MTNLNPTHTIELDCAPGAVRPENLIAGVLADTGFSVEDFDTGAPFFGCQTWALKDAARVEEFKTQRPVFKARVEALYHAGRIRYGSW